MALRIRFFLFVGLHFTFGIFKEWRSGQKLNHVLTVLIHPLELSMLVTCCELFT